MVLHGGHSGSSRTLVSCAVLCCAVLRADRCDAWVCVCWGDNISRWWSQLLDTDGAAGAPVQEKRQRGVCWMG
jgi:hypothetical protein